MKAGWEVKKLGEVCTVIAGQSPEGRFYNALGDGLPFYQGKKEFSEKYIGKPTTWTTFVTKEAEKDDVLMSVRAPVGPINFSTEKICIGRGLAAIRASDLIDKDFLFNFLLKHETEIVGNTGAVFDSINKSQIEDILIPTPPIQEQQRIVAILDQAFEGIAKARANAEQNLQNARALFESYLQSVFTQRGEGWFQDKLVAFTYTVSTGPFGSLLHKADYVSEGVPLVNPINIVNNSIVPNESKQINIATKARLQSYILKEGDIVIGRRGEIGRCAVVSEKESGWICGTGCFFIRPLPTTNSQFLANLIRSGNYREKLEQASSGATMLNLSNKALCDLEIAMPNFEEQENILKKLDALSKETQCLEAHCQRKITLLDELKKSLLQRAFAGEL